MTTQDLEKKIEELETRIEELVKHNVELLENLEKEKKNAESNWRFYREESERRERLQEKLNVISKITEF